MNKIKPIIFGMLAAFGALVIELVISDVYFIFSGKDLGLSYSEEITVFLFLVVFIEEIVKYILLLKLYATPNSKNPKISTAILAGLGFALIESSFVYVNYNFANLYYGITSAAALHIATAGLIGYLIISTKKSNFSSIKIVISAFSLHILYNLMIINNFNYWLIFFYLALIFFALAISNLKLHHKNAV